jgi:LPXTG-site transpeptidase (sortase) family protein
MSRSGGKFKLPRAKLGLFFGIFYFAAIAGFTAAVFIPKAVDASSEERLFMPSIGLIARVKDIERQGNQLIAPDTIAGAYHPTNHKYVIIGHSSTIFKDLKNASMDDNFTFDGKSYKIVSREILEKSSVDMEDVVSETEISTVILMTCYGEPLGGQDYTHRLVITAEEV